MLFNSYEFILAFLPVTLILFRIIDGRGHNRAAKAFLACASLGFYAWWDTQYAVLLVGLMTVNYWIGLRLARAQGQAPGLLALGIAGNLAVLGWFKYAGFLTVNLNAAVGLELVVPTIALPLAISFFTFQKIAFLVDTHRGRIGHILPLDYAFFVLFFPQLIAGPIVHYREIAPQLHRGAGQGRTTRDLAIGLSLFIIGLSKKVLVADSIEPLATATFNAAADGVAVTFFEAWLGAIAYSLQLYFDFSGYSDMAIGLARMFGIRLPMNFFSPYKANTVIEFWQRWHITLSRFLRDYLYIPLGGNRLGEAKRYRNLIATMVIGGLWHGAAWTFVAWGALHAAFLVVNHAWQTFSPRRMPAWSGRVLTLLAACVAWVFFRADSVAGALAMLKAMVGGNGLSLVRFLSGRLGGAEAWLNGIGIHFDGVFHNAVVQWGTANLALVLGAMALTQLAPNSSQLLAAYRPTLSGVPAPSRPRRLRWAPNAAWAMALGLMATFAFFNLVQPSKFLYFQF